MCVIFFCFSFIRGCPDSARNRLYVTVGKVLLQNERSVLIRLPHSEPVSVSHHTQQEIQSGHADVAIHVLCCIWPHSPPGRLPYSAQFTFSHSGLHAPASPSLGRLIFFCRCSGPSGLFDESLIKGLLIEAESKFREHSRPCF